MMRDDFAVFICSHKRPECKTYHTLRNCGYTGEIYIVLDDKDDTYWEYVNRYGPTYVLQFDKERVWTEFDTCTKYYLPAAVVYPRRECLRIANELNIKYYLTIDDDVETLRFKTLQDDKLRSSRVSNLDCLFDRICEYFEHTKINAIGISDSGIFFGGKNGVWKDCIRNTFSVGIFCRADLPINFFDTFNEDVATSITENRLGNICFELLDICESSATAGKNEVGGMAQTYKIPKVIRSQFTYILFPDCVTLKENGDIRWNRRCMCPEIISDKYKK